MVNFFFIPIIFFYVIYLAAASKNGLTVDLIHRDSPLSPLRNPNATQFECLQNMFHRSIARKASLSMSVPVVEHGVGEYLMKISVGTPRFETLTIVDTGSDLLWVPCVCMGRRCDRQNFNPNKSTSYRVLSCESKKCSPYKTSCNKGNTCQYSISYRDNSSSKGDLAEDRLTLQSSSGESKSFPVVFGCGHENRDETGVVNSSIGIVGLGLGTLSIAKQLRKSFGRKFSYCFTHTDYKYYPPSKFTFGSNPLVSGPNVVSTPLLTRKDTNYYYLHFKGVSVGDKRLNYEDTSINEDKGSVRPSVIDGNMIIDSGTMFTSFLAGFYLKFESELRKKMKETDCNQRIHPYKFCCDLSRSHESLPKIVFHFHSADLELPLRSAFDQQERMFCLTILPSGDGDTASILGNRNQMNYFVEYDLGKKEISFLPTNCSKFP